MIKGYHVSDITFTWFPDSKSSTPYTINTNRKGQCRKTRKEAVSLAKKWAGSKYNIEFVKSGSVKSIGKTNPQPQKDNTKQKGKPTSSKKSDKETQVKSPTVADGALKDAILEIGLDALIATKILKGEITPNRLWITPDNETVTYTTVTGGKSIRFYSHKDGGKRQIPQREYHRVRLIYKI
jgi:hypothetical protein